MSDSTLPNGDIGRKGKSKEETSDETTKQEEEVSPERDTHPPTDDQSQGFSVEPKQRQGSETLLGLGQQIKTLDYQADRPLPLENLRMREFLDQPADFVWSNGKNHIEFMPNEEYPFDFHGLLGHSGKA